MGDRSSWAVEANPHRGSGAPGKRRAARAAAASAVLAQGSAPSPVALRADEMKWTPQGSLALPSLEQVSLVGDASKPGPDTIRLGVAPLYTRYVDVWDAVEHLSKVLRDNEWDQPQFKLQAMVT